MPTTKSTTTTPRSLDMSKINRVDVDLPTKNLDISLPIPYLSSQQTKNKNTHPEHEGELVFLINKKKQ